MRLCSLLLVIASGLLVSSEVFAVTSDGANTLTIQNNQHATRFLRTHHAHAAEATKLDEERAGMTYAGFLRDKQEARKWLQLWFNNKEPVTSVAAKLGVFQLSQNAAVQHTNWKALVKYMRMSVLGKNGQNYAKFGTGYQTEAKTKEYLMKWALQEESPKVVAQTLRMSHLTEAQRKVHVNYNAFNTYLEYLAAVKKMRAS